MKKTLILACALLLCCGLSQAQTLKETVGKHFLIGTALNMGQVKGMNAKAADVVKNQFNAIVAENCMKPESLEPAEGQFHWDDADQFVQFGLDNHLAVTGHVLVWHSQTAPWMFRNQYGDMPNREQMIQRMHDYIHTVVSHFKGKVRGWDVVNEALNDDGTLRPSPWLRAIGPDYIQLAFKFAHEADPDCELYYNDYSLSLPAKRRGVVRLIAELKAAGCRIDAVGMQSHGDLEEPNLADYEASIQAFIGAGVNVMATELDVSVLPNPYTFSGADISQRFQLRPELNPYPKRVPKAVLEQQARRYAALFGLYKKYEAHISRVTFWGVGDGDSWLNDFPVKGRTNYPLLFDRNYKAKPALKAITDLF
jgi:endo-1,4-beta-xylanase